MNKRRIGHEYELLAADYLKKIGYVILELNYRNKSGEIDLIAIEKGIPGESKDTLVYVEIKFRSSEKCGYSLEAVDYRKQRQISKVALYHYAGSPYYGKIPVRFDVIGIDGKDQITHIKNAFDFQY